MMRPGDGSGVSENSASLPYVNDLSRMRLSVFTGIANEGEGPFEKNKVNFSD